MSDAEEAAAIQCWNQLIDDILADKIDRVELFGSELYQYHLDDHSKLRQQSMNLVAALAATAPPNLRIISLGHTIFQALDPIHDQPDVFTMIGKLPGIRSISLGGLGGTKRQTCFNTDALIDGLKNVRKGLRSLRIQGLEISTTTQAANFATALEIQVNSLRDIRLSDLECPVDESATGLLDPFIAVFSKCRVLNDLKLRTNNFSNGTLREPSPSHAPLISVSSIKSLLVNPHRDQGWKLVTLAGLGLQDGHILTIVDQMLTKPAVVAHLDLCDNPSITKDGYDTLSLMIQGQGSIQPTIKVSDSTWAAKFDAKAAAQRRDSLQSTCSYGSATSDDSVNDDDPLGGSQTGW
jgi:hypothetical protein